MMRFWSALSGQLRALGVTTLHTMELPEFIGTEIRAPLGGISFLSEVLVLLRYVRCGHRPYRMP